QFVFFSNETAIARPSYGASVKRVGFRGRLFLILLAFALVPSILVSLAWSATGSFVLPMFGTSAAWDSAAVSGERAADSLRTAPSSAVTPSPTKQRGAAHRNSRYSERECAKWRVSSSWVARAHSKPSALRRYESQRGRLPTSSRILSRRSASRWSVFAATSRRS